MVKKLFWLLTLPVFLFSAEFTSSLDQNPVPLGETVTLSLVLQDASASSDPQIGDLGSTFRILKQDQQQKAFIINGKVTTSRIWQITLIPENVGEFTLPSFSINTNVGTLTTQPLRFAVVKQAAEMADIKVLTLLSKNKPYKNETFFYTLRIMSKTDLANVSREKLEIENASVEEFEISKPYQQVVEGVNYGMIDFTYLVTPLKAGLLKIPSTTIQGVTPIRRKGDRNFFNDDFFGMMQGFSQLKPFALKTEENLIEIQVPVEGIKPWLPAQMLTLEEIWPENQTFKVGEPLTRGFKLLAVGVKSNNLPSLNDLHLKDSHFKSYADTPEVGDKVQNGFLTSFRKEQLTLIPQQAGEVTLPEISIAWWDVNKNEKVFARIPARTLNIEAAPQVTNDLALADEPLLTPLPLEKDNTTLYLVAGGLTFLLSVVITWGIYLQRRLAYLTKPVEETKPASLPSIKKDSDYAPKPPKESKDPKKGKLPDLNPT